MILPLSRDTPLVGAIMKLEAPYVVEWVAWHRMQGFDLMIADNCREGAQTALLRKLARHSLIHYVDARHASVPPQMRVYKTIFFNALRLGYRYLGYLDADEFFEPLGKNRFDGAALVRAVLDQPGISTCVFQWAIFGSAGLTHQSHEPVVERFPLRGEFSTEMNRHEKSFARVSGVLRRYILGGFRFKRAMKYPHLFRFNRKQIYHDVAPELIRDQVAGASWRSARIRHYAVKSLEEFEIKSRLRKDAFYPERTRGRAYWESFDKNDVEDRFPADVCRDLRAEMNRIQSLVA